MNRAELVARRSAALKTLLARAEAYDLVAPLIEVDKLAIAAGDTEFSTRLRTEIQAASTNPGPAGMPESTARFDSVTDELRRPEAIAGIAGVASDASLPPLVRGICRSKAVPSLANCYEKCEREPHYRRSGCRARRSSSDVARKIAQREPYRTLASVCSCSPGGCAVPWLRVRKMQRSAEIVRCFLESAEDTAEIGLSPGPVLSFLTSTTRR